MIQVNLIPSRELNKAILKLENSSFILGSNKKPVVELLSIEEISSNLKLKKRTEQPLNFEVQILANPLDFIKKNDAALREDFQLITKNRKSQPITKYVKTANPTSIFIERGARLEHCILNASEGPIYIGKNALIMEGAILRGPVSIGENSVVKMNATIYGATTIGKSCLVGGEIKNSIFFDYSNKAHHGYIGDSVIGSYCNLGAGTSNSNIKNNASAVYIKFSKTTLKAGIKCGMFMGDYSRTAINTSINTGPVIGVCCNIFDAGLTPKSVPNFSWGNNQKYEFQTALVDIEEWKKLKNKSITKEEKEVLKAMYKNQK